LEAKLSWRDRSTVLGSRTGWLTLAVRVVVPKFLANLGVLNTRYCPRKAVIPFRATARNGRV
jgi:hypothetical protein